MQIVYICTMRLINVRKTVYSNRNGSDHVYHAGDTCDATCALSKQDRCKNANNVALHAGFPIKYISSPHRVHSGTPLDYSVFSSR